MLIVGYQNGCGLGLAQDIADFSGKPIPERNVEVGEGLIEQHQIRLRCQGPGERHALLLSARELVGIAVCLLAQADQFEHVL